MESQYLKIAVHISAPKYHDSIVSGDKHIVLAQVFMSHIKQMYKIFA